MKSRRITIFCVAMIALAGTPRAWQEVGKLLNIVQHKAQVKFWSMVLPGDKASASIELIASAETSEAASTCPTAKGEAWENQARSSFKTNHRIARAFVQTKSRAQRQTDSAPASHAGLIAKARKAPLVDDSTKILLHSLDTWESQPRAIAMSAPVPLVTPSAAPVPPQPASASDTFRYVLIPPASVSAALVEKEAVVQFKLIRKSIEDKKLLRQKGRLPASNGLTAFPSS